MPMTSDVPQHIENEVDNMKGKNETVHDDDDYQDDDARTAELLLSLSKQ